MLKRSATDSNDDLSLCRFRRNNPKKAVFEKASSRPIGPGYALLLLSIVLIGAGISCRDGNGTGETLSGNSSIAATTTEEEAITEGETNPEETPAPEVDYVVAVLSWEAPSTNEDGTPLDDLAGFVVHYGDTPGEYKEAIDVGNVTEYAFEAAAPGPYYFSVTAYDTSANESDFSEEVFSEIVF